MTDILENHIGGSVCVVAFSTHGAKQFEWKRTLDGLGVSYILMRDKSQKWYTDGVESIGNIQAVVEFLQDTISTHSYLRVITLGLSSGAYGAMLFGARVPADEIILISPVTVLGPSKVREFHPAYAVRLGLPAPLSVELDLRETLLAWGLSRPPFLLVPYKISAFVSDGDGAELDARMCELIGVTPTLIPGHSHSALGRHMVDSGMIRNLILGG